SGVLAVLRRAAAEGVRGGPPAAAAVGRVGGGRDEDRAVGRVERGGRGAAGGGLGDGALRARREHPEGPGLAAAEREALLEQRLAAVGAHRREAERPEIGRAHV